MSNQDRSASARTATLHCRCCPVRRTNGGPSGDPSTWSQNTPPSENMKMGCYRLTDVSGIHFCDGSYIGPGNSFDISVNDVELHITSSDPSGITYTAPRMELHTIPGSGGESAQIVLDPSNSSTSVLINAENNAYRGQIIVDTDNRLLTLTMQKISDPSGEAASVLIDGASEYVSMTPAAQLTRFMYTKTNPELEYRSDIYVDLGDEPAYYPTMAPTSNGQTLTFTNSGGLPPEKAMLPTENGVIGGVARAVGSFNDSTNTDTYIAWGVETTEGAHQVIITDKNCQSTYAIYDLDGPVNCIIRDPLSSYKIWIGGSFTQVTNLSNPIPAPCNNIFSLTFSETIGSSQPPDPFSLVFSGVNGLNGTVHAFAILDAGPRLAIAGAFTDPPEGTSYLTILKSDQSGWDPSIHPNGPCYAIDYAQYNGDNLLVFGGTFEEITDNMDTIPAKNIGGFYSPTGGIFTPGPSVPLGQLNGAVRAVKIIPDDPSGNVYFGGDFTAPFNYYGSFVMSNITTFISPTGGAPPAPVRALEYMTAPSTVVVGGDGFLRFNGINATLPNNAVPDIYDLHWVLTISNTPSFFLYIAANNRSSEDYPISYFIPQYKMEDKPVEIQGFNFTYRPDSDTPPVAVFSTIVLGPYSSINFIGDKVSSKWLLASNYGGSF